MSFFKRAYLAVTRRKARTCIMLVILMAIATLIYTGLSVQNATNEASILARQKLGSILTLTFDSQKAMQNNMKEANVSEEGRRNIMEIEHLAVTEDMAKKIADNKHVYDYNYIVNTSVFASSFDAIEDSQGSQIREAEDEMRDKVNSFNDSIAGGERNMPRGIEKIDMKNIVMTDISIVGVSSSAIYEDFASNGYEVTEGESITKETIENGVLIEKTLAETNSIAIDDVIKIKATSEGEDIELVVVGIYDLGNTNNNTMFSGMSSTLSYNKMFVRYDKAVAIKEIAEIENESLENTPMVRGRVSSSKGIDSVIFYIDDPNNIETVLEYSKTTDIDFETYTLSANNEEYESMIKPIENVASFSKILVIIVIIAGIAIIALILMLWIKERTYETGVLLSLGEGKFKIIMQYLSEVLIIAIVAFSLSILIGTGISQKVGDVLLSQELETLQETQNKGFNPQSGNISRVPMGEKSFKGQGQEIANNEQITEIDVNVSLNVILQMYGLGIGIILIATMVPVIYVFRYNPKQILTNVG